MEAWVSGFSLELPGVGTTLSQSKRWIDMDVQALPTCILLSLKYAFGLAFYICNAMLSLSVLFQRRKQLSALRHARKMQLRIRLFCTQLVFTTKDQRLTQFYCGCGRSKLRECILPTLKNAPEHVLPDSGSVSVLLQNVEHCSKHVFQFLQLLLCTENTSEESNTS